MEKSFVEHEKEILKKWQAKKIFKQSLENTKSRKLYSFYDGPPFATGLPHYGHIVASLMKDVVPRYFTMRGRSVPRRWGWDCHGLPIENIVEEELGLKSKKDIVKIGVAKFNQTCKSKVLTYAQEWRKTVDRVGRWVDMDNDYKTMDLAYMESVWWVFKQLWDKGLVYEDYKSMHICPRCETTLAQAEVTEGYKIIKDLSVIAKFELVDEPKTYILAWTTTPWTLPGNVALAVGKGIEYIKVQSPSSRDKYIFATTRAEFAGLPIKGGEKVDIKKLVGKKYKPLFPYYRDSKIENAENFYTVQGADFVSTDEGTGVVHIAPAFGEDDMNLGKSKKLPFIQHVSMDGTFKAEVTDFSGQPVKPKEDPTKADVEIIKYLAQKSLLYKKEKFEHSYPHCWRCESPLLNYATNSWFVAVTKLKSKLLKNAKKINWVPGHIKEGRFGNWLEGARDWAVSRQRFWGSVMPVWRCECGEMKVFGAVAELEEASGKKVADLHKHVVDEITVPCPRCQKIMRRIPDVLDTWFDSGSMPYAQAHYPFENKKEFESSFPAEFIAEGVDQTIKWFYYLHVIATALFNKPAYRNVVVNGIVLAEDGRKMSKRLKNYPAPEEIFEKYGADAMRYYLVTSAVMKAEDLRFSEKEVLEVYRNVIMLTMNVVSFYNLYKQNTGDKMQDTGSRNRKTKSQHILDQWIEARLNELTTQVTSRMEEYDLSGAARPLAKFINDLSTWYLRRSRERFKDGDAAGIMVFGQVLLGLSKLLAPFTPFLAEYVYGEAGGLKESVHLEEWPKVSAKSKSQIANRKILEEMEKTRKIVELGLAARAEAKIKVRQPLSEIKITNYELDEVYSELIRDELNVKKVSGEKGGELKVQFDTTLNPQLVLEGEAREFIRQVNTLRKNFGLTVSDSITLYYDGEIHEMMALFIKDIMKQTVAEKILRGVGDQEIVLDGKKISLRIEKNKS